MELADKLGMRYYGNPDSSVSSKDKDTDRRLLNYKLPAICQYVDLRLFYQEAPDHPGAIGMQLDWYTLKYFHYLEGLAHLFNTGEGVIHERSLYSDYVFFKALQKVGYNKFSNNSYEYYDSVRVTSTADLIRPHVVIYLDVPPEKVLENVKKRNIPWEANSKIMTLDYMKAIDQVYKEQALPEYAKHAEVLVYDWSEGGDIDLVIEDLEKIDFDGHLNSLSQKMEDWRWFRDSDFDDLRRLYTNERDGLYKYFFQPDYDSHDIRMEQETAALRKAILDRHDADFPEGFNERKHSFWNLLTKRDTKNYRSKHEMFFFGQSLRDEWTPDDKYV